MFNNKKPIVIGLAAAAATWLQTPPALAQEGVLEEVVVTARKRVENLQEVPIAISAFDAETIERAGIERPGDYLNLIPNVTLVDTANVGDTQVSIRGIVSTRDAESSFAYVVDGVLSTNPNSFNEDLFDVQQIEVLKGPQGALYGRNAVAGAILVTTKAPTDEFEAELVVGAGNDDHRKARGVISGPIVGDSLLGRLAVSWSEHDGSYENIFTNQDDAVDYREDTSVRTRLIWKVSEDLSFDFRAGYSEVEGGAINFNAAFALPAFQAQTGNQSFMQDVNDMDFRFTFNVPGENEQETLDLALKMDWHLGFADLVGYIAYNDLDEYLLSDGTSATFFGYEVTQACLNDRASLNSFTRPDLFGPQVDPFLVLPPSEETNFAGIYGPYTATACDGYQYQERNQEDLSIDVRLVSPGDQSLRWIAGLFFTEIEREVVVAYGADQGRGFLRQPYVPADGPNPTDLLFWDDFDTTVYAIYGQLEFDITERLELELSARYDREEREVENKVPNVLNSGLNLNLNNPQFSGNPGPINPALVSNPGGVPDRDDDFTQFQPKVSLNWAAADDFRLYASYGVGFRSGGFNSVGTEDLLNTWFNAGYGGPGEFVDAQLLVKDDYDKEVTETFEIGMKSEFFDNRLRLNAAIFHTEVEDNQFFEFFAGPFGLLRSVTTIDELEITGFEADFSWLVANGLTFYGGIGLMDSEIKENKNRPLSEGNDVPQAPEETGNLGVQWVVPMAENLDIVARLDWSYVGEMWFHTLQGEQTPTIWNALFAAPGVFSQDFSNSRRDSYDTLDLRVSLEGKNWTLTAWGRNITDEEYLQEVIPAPEFGGSFNHPSAERTYGVEFAYRF